MEGFFLPILKSEKPIVSLQSDYGLAIFLPYLAP